MTHPMKKHAVDSQKEKMESVMSGDPSGMTAGALSGEGRLQKMEIHEKAPKGEPEV